MKLVDNEIGISWKKLKEKNQEKVNWNVHKNEIEVKEGTFRGILVGDKELEMLENESKTEMDGKAIVHAGIEVDEKEKEILNLPPDFAIFPKVDIEEFETDMEKCLIKCSWDTKNVQRKIESEKASNEASDNSDEVTSEKKLYDTEEKRLDFRNLKATDFKNNKRVILPEPDDDNEEIRRKNLKAELKNIVIKYRNENCDKSGNIIENNLDKKQLKDIKNLKKRMKKEGLAAGETDKTGKLTLDTLENVVEKSRSI